VLAFYALTFAISWGSLLIVLGPGGLARSTWQSDPGVMLMGVALLAGPSLASIILTAYIDGRAGLAELRSRLFRWRVGARWYAVALLATPVLAAITSLLLSPNSSEFVPAIAVSSNRLMLVLSATLVGLAIGFCEELGWTGFAVPRLRAHHGLVSTGLSLGVVWGLWHFPPFWESDSFAAAMPFALLAARLLSWLPPFRLLMVWLYERTGSLLLVMLMHASLVASTTFIFAPAAASRQSMLTHILIWAAVLWLVAAAVVEHWWSNASQPSSAAKHLLARGAMWVMEAFLALSAIQGGLALLRGEFDSILDVGWLAGTPFVSYAIPALILVFVVGGGALCAAAMVFLRRRWAVGMSIAAGLIMVGFLIVEAICLDAKVGDALTPVLTLQGLYLVVGLAIAGLGARIWWRDESRPA
jgi:membrane protease YdiL (CAAX protease family)